MYITQTLPNSQECIMPRSAHKLEMNLILKQSISKVDINKIKNSNNHSTVRNVQNRDAQRDC